MNKQYRILYKKGQALRYTANLDLHKIWERWMRRAGIPLAYSQGFHPQPRMNQAAPLPLGMLSDGEIIDIWVDESCDLDSLILALNTVQQPGIDILEIKEIVAREPSIQVLVHHIEYMAELLTGTLEPDIQDRIQKMLETDELLRTRRKKEYNLRPLILSCNVVVANDPLLMTIQMVLLSLPGQTGRPDEVISALGMDPMNFRYTRKQIFLASH